MINPKNSRVARSLAAVAATFSTVGIASAADNSVGVAAAWQKPAWLTDLSLGVKES